MSLLLLLTMLALDGGTPLGVPAPAGPDQEVIENLELLENLDGAADLELLEELSLER